MKIIDLGIVVDNKDPQNIGRIRYFSFDDEISTKQRSYTGQPWAKNDPMVAMPFLPTHINIIPSDKQSVKIIKHIAEAEGLVNQEYVPGPYTTAHDFPSQQKANQTTYYSEGVTSIPNPDINDSNHWHHFCI